MSHFNYSRCTSWIRLTLLLVFIAAFSEPVQIHGADGRPNIVYIMSDDMGYSDIGCYGGEIQTPRLDELASHGVRFTQFYNMGRCCPTRASLLTGLYPHQAGIGHMMDDHGYDGYRGDLNCRCVTIAEVLGTAGYRNYIAGKWHVTRKIKPNDELEKHNWPLQRGFDRFYGTIHGAGSFYDPNSLTRDNTLISPYDDPEYQPENGYYYTDAIADHAARFVREHHEQTPDAPFFMYVAFTAAHWPMHAREEDIAKYRGKYDVGYQAIREARYKRMVELGVVDPDATQVLAIDPDWMETDYLEWDIRNMEVYAAMIDRMDQGVGRIVDALRATGQLDNTLVLFLQDNGGCAENYGRSGEGQPRADAPPLPPLEASYLQVDMQPKQTRDGYPVRTGKGVMAGPGDTYLGYGKGWATVSNTPFREYKHWVHEGGISTPLIAHWPAHIARAGELEHTPGHLIDLMATAVDLSGATYPETFHDGQTIQPMEGVSLRPAFRGEPLEREAIYWEHEGNRAIRRGDFKLVAKGALGPWELYNIRRDRSEQNDLARKRPGLVAELSAMWNDYAERASVLPLVPYQNKKPTPEQIARQKSKLKFTLAEGDDLDRDDSPYILGRRMTVQADIATVGDGVVVAQGGGTEGWAIYIRDGRPHIVTTHGKRRILHVAHQPISGSGVLRARLGVDLPVELHWNDTELVRGEAGWDLTRQPTDGLQVGSDRAGSVGEYPQPFPFTGKIDQVVIELE